MKSGARWLYGVFFAANLVMIAVALSLWGAAEVRADGGEILFLTAAGAGWLGLATALFSWLGLSLRDDAGEQKNVAALVALCGALAGAALIYAGGSIGEGPSYGNNVFSVGLAASGYFGLWIMLELAGGVSRSITEDRDLASGLRLCGLLIAMGLVLGRAVAGDWHSEAATVHDFIRDGWPVVMLWAIASGCEILLRPNRRRPFPAWPAFGLLPALIYVALSGAWLWHLGAWEGMH